MKRLFLSLALFLAASAFAQTAPLTKISPKRNPPASTKSTKTADPEAAKVADIHRLLQLTGTREMVNEMKSTMMAQFRRNAPTLPPEMLDEMASELKAEELEESMIPVYSRHFSGQDIKQLIAFYQSPFGKRVLKEMPQIILESNEVGMHWGETVVTRVAGKWRDRGKISQHAYDQLVGGMEEQN